MNSLDRQDPPSTWSSVQVCVFHVHSELRVWLIQLK